MRIIRIADVRRLPDKPSGQSALIVCGIDQNIETELMTTQEIELSQTNSKQSSLQQNYVLIKVDFRDLQTSARHFITRHIILLAMRFKLAQVFIYAVQELACVVEYLQKTQFSKLTYKYPKPSPFYNQLTQLFSNPLPSPLHIFVSIYRIAPFCYHTAVDFGQFEVSFGKSKAIDEGCYFVVSRQNTAYKYLRQQYVGICYKTADYLARILEKGEREWKSSDYRLIHHNCNDFCIELLKALDLCCRLDEVTRLSRFAKKVVHA